MTLIFGLNNWKMEFSQGETMKQVWGGRSEGSWGRRLFRIQVESDVGLEEKKQELRTRG